MTRRSFAGRMAGAAALRAQEETTAQKRGRGVVEKAIDALGGDGFRFMRARMESGRAYSFYLDKISGLSMAHIYTRYVSEGDVKEQQRQAFGKKQEDFVLLKADSAWEVNFRGARPLGDERLKQFRDTTLHDIFYILRARRDEPGMVFEHKGQDVVENSPVETVEIYDADNRNVTVWIHSSTFLPVKQRFFRWDDVVKDRREEITRYTKYRESGNGVVWPHDIQRERDGSKIFEMYADKVVVGDPYPDSMFEVPSGGTVLKKG